MRFPNAWIRTLGLPFLIGTLILLGLLWASRAPSEGARLRGLKIRTASDQRRLLSHRGAPVVSLVCRDRREIEPANVRRRLQQVASSASGKLSDLVVNRLQTSNGGTIATAAVEFEVAVPAKDLPNLLWALDRFGRSIFYDDVDLSRASGSTIAVDFKGRVICYGRPQP